MKPSTQSKYFSRFNIALMNTLGIFYFADPRLKDTLDYRVASCRSRALFIV